MFVAGRRAINTEPRRGGMWTCRPYGAQRKNKGLELQTCRPYGAMTLQAASNTLPLPRAVLTCPCAAAVASKRKQL